MLASLAYGNEELRELKEAVEVKSVPSTHNTTLDSPSSPVGTISPYMADDIFVG